MPVLGDIDLSYPSKLKAIGITLLEQFTGAKKQHLMQCDSCQYEWEATPISKLQNFKKWGRGGCPECHRTKEYSERREQNIVSIQTRGFEILSPFNGSYVNEENVPTRLTVRNTNCNHQFDIDAKNLLSRNVICPICNKAEKIKRLNANSKARSVEWQKTADM